MKTVGFGIALALLMLLIACSPLGSGETKEEPRKNAMGREVRSLPEMSDEDYRKYRGTGD